MLVETATLEDVAWMRKVFDADRDILWHFNTIWYRNGLGGASSAGHHWIVIRPLALAHYHTRRKDGMTILDEIVVDREHRREGLAKMLVDATPRPMMLKTDVGNEPSNAFYRRLGFSLMGQITGKLNNSRTLNIYQKW